VTLGGRVLTARPSTIHRTPMIALFDIVSSEFLQGEEGILSLTKQEDRADAKREDVLPPVLEGLEAVVVLDSVDFGSGTVGFADTNGLPTSVAALKSCFSSTSFPLP